MVGPAVVHQWLTTAATAPSLHNSQPWLFGIRGGGIDVYADRTRQMPVVDPSARELMLSLGAAVFTLRVAMLASGRTPELRLLPVPGMADLVARVRPGQSGTGSPTATVLASAALHRHSNRWPFRPLALPDDTLAELVASAAAEGAVLRIADPVRRTTVVGLTRAAEAYWRNNATYRRELAEWTDRPSGDGIPRAAAGPRAGPGGPPLRDFRNAPDPARPVLPFETRPTIAVLHTADTAAGWLRAGQALQRVLLTATVRGAAATLMTQALEIPAARDLLTDPATGYPAQAVLRLGYPTHPVDATPRRPSTDVLLRT